jgi:hypothetical protein
MKSVTSVLNVETDRVDNTVGTGNGCLYGALVMCVRGDLLDASVLARRAMRRALLRRSTSALVAGKDFSICLSCASLRPETWPMSSMSRCSNIF